MIVQDSMIYNITENTTQVAVTHFYPGEIVPIGVYDITLLINMVSLSILNTINFSENLLPLNSWKDIPSDNITWIDIPSNSNCFGIMLIRKFISQPKLEIMSKKRIKRFLKHRSINNDPTRAWKYKIQFK